MSDHQIDLHIDLADGREIHLQGDLPDDSHVQVILRVKQGWLRRRHFRVAFFGYIKGDANNRVVETIYDHRD